ncbi:MAG: multidrug effflux MFS transporter [Rhodospirillaceae bacterium]|nr:multidrug effflux MFS transporter [Rhodospirillaceae bacterium]MBT5944740.1 multidrug effflux MFS transporter [Rhodospirillaceae bacterium]MBT6310760.1 multidrug effflux MFS transporter [Rhodospirillaceae bacterium]MBT6537217.1 multidrug effflux MFS transporter [Rhodospirillaceae bacterium]MBT7360704.1 multidrug effflux MFS transporter [Rhodospirillaceae bacterium]
MSGDRVTPPANTKMLIGVLAFITALGPLAMQIILPVLPVMQDAFMVSAGTVQYVLSLALFTIAFATLVYGPASDRYGRRPVLLVGLVIFLLGSVVSAVAPTIEVLIVGRVTQAVGGAAGMVVSRAIIRDLYDRDTAARLMAYMITALVVAPMVSPLIGGLLNDAFGWRAIFIFSGVIGVIVLAVALPRVPESLQPGTSAQTFRGMLSGFGVLLRVPAFLGYAGQAGFGMGMFMAFLGAAPFVTINVLERPPTEFGLFFILISAGFMAGTFLTARLGQRIGLDRMMRIGSGLAVAFGVVMLAFVLAGIWSPWTIFLPGMGMAFANGLSMPNAQAGAVSISPRFAGTASGLLAFLQMLMGAGFAQLAGMVQDDTPLPMTVIMLAASVLAFLCAMFLTRVGGDKI